MKRLFDRDPSRGLTTWWEDTPEGFLLRYEQDVEPLIDENRRKQNAGRDYYASAGDYWKVASIPVTVQYKWMIEDGIDITNPDHWPRVQRKLNDPDWRYLKTAEVIV